MNRTDSLTIDVAFVGCSESLVLTTGVVCEQRYSQMRADGAIGMRLDQNALHLTHDAPVRLVEGPRLRKIHCGVCWVYRASGSENIMATPTGVEPVFPG